MVDDNGMAADLAEGVHNSISHPFNPVLLIALECAAKATASL